MRASPNKIKLFVQSSEACSQLRKLPLEGKLSALPTDEVYKGCLPAKRSGSFAFGEMARFESKIRSAPPFPAAAFPLLFLFQLS